MLTPDVFYQNRFNRPLWRQRYGSALSRVALAAELVDAVIETTKTQLHQSRFIAHAGSALSRINGCISLLPDDLLAEALRLACEDRLNHSIRMGRS